MDSSDPVVSPEQEKSMQAALRQSTWWAVMNGFGNPYLVPFALALGATASQVGLLAAFPAALAALTSLLSGQLVEKLGNRKPLVVASLVGQAFCWLFILLIPFVLPFDFWVPALIALVCVYMFFTYISGAAWDSMMADVVPQGFRSTYFSRRNQVINAVSLGSTLVAGFLLGLFVSGENQSPFAFVGFALLFFIAFASRMISRRSIVKVTDFPYKAEEIIISPKKIFEGIGKNEFVNAVFFISLASFGISIASPLFGVLLIRDLGFSPLVFGLITMAPMLSTVFSLPYWGRISDRLGRKTVLWVCTALFPLFPLSWILFQNPVQLFLAQFFFGFVQAGFNLNALNLVMDSSPKNGRATYLGFYSFLIQSGVFAGGIIGGLLVWLLEARSILFLHGLGIVFAIAAVACLVPIYWLYRIEPSHRKSRSVELIWNTAFLQPSLTILEEIGEQKKRMDQLGALTLMEILRLPQTGISLSAKTLQLVQKTSLALEKELADLSHLTFSELAKVPGTGVQLSSKTQKLIAKTVKALEAELKEKD